MSSNVSETVKSHADERTHTLISSKLVNDRTLAYYMRTQTRAYTFRARIICIFAFVVCLFRVRVSFVSISVFHNSNSASLQRASFHNYLYFHFYLRFVLFLSLISFFFGTFFPISPFACCIECSVYHMQCMT